MQQNLHLFWVIYSHSFHSLEAEKGPMSFTFGHTHPVIVGIKSPPPPGHGWPTVLAGRHWFRTQWVSVECFKPNRHLGSFSRWKTSLDVFSLGLKQVWTCSVLGDRIYEMKGLKRVRTSGIKTWRSFLLYLDPWWTQHQPGINPPKKQLVISSYDQQGILRAYSFLGAEALPRTPMGV